MGNPNYKIKYKTPFIIDLSEKIDDGSIADYLHYVAILPIKLQVKLKDFTTAEFIYDQFGTKFQITVDQQDDVIRIIRDIILGDTQLIELKDAVEKRLQVDEKIAGEITNTLLEQIFAPVWDELKQRHMEKFGAGASAGSNIVMETPQPIAPPARQPQAPLQPAPVTNPPPQAATTTAFGGAPLKAVARAQYYPVRNGIIATASLAKRRNQLQPFLTSANQNQPNQQSPNKPITLQRQNQTNQDIPGMTVNLRDKFKNRR